MKDWKKFLLLLLVFFGGHIAAFAQKFSVKNRDGVKIQYQVISIEEKTVRVVGVGRTSMLTIPETVDYKKDSYTVVSIGMNVWGNQNNVTKQVTLPSTIKLIEPRAFSNGHVLQGINIPEGVTEIGDEAFSGCNGLGSLMIPEGVTRIGERAFCSLDLMSKLSGRTGLFSSLLDQLSGIETDYFHSISIPNSVVYIGKDAFALAIFTPNGKLSFVPKEWTFTNLPPMVTKENCESFGIKRTSIDAYLATRSGNDIHSQPDNTNQPKVPVTQKMPETPTSDVDVNIPENTTNNNYTFAVIFANENYQEEVNVAFALNDGEMFKQYCHKVFGMPEENIHIRRNATLNNMKAEIAWMQQVAKAYKGEARFFLYYAGHGIPDEKSGVSYLLPVDGKATMVETGYSLDNFYEALSMMPVKNVTVFMDACFSGSKRGEGMLTSVRGVAVKAKAQTPKGNVVVFSAAQGDETAYPFKEKKHGLFTYFLLKKLKDTQGNVSYEALASYLCDQVTRKSIVANGKSQTPTVMSSASISDSWKALKLK